jgi:2-methylcitrate dehydratase PrpD
MAQPFIDCSIKLKSEISNVDEIDRIVAKVGEGTVHRLWEPLEEKQNPSSPYGAKFSVPYCIAVGLIDGQAGLKQFTEKRLQDPSLLNLASKVSYEINPDDEYPKNYTGDITIFNKNGTTLSANQNCLRGGKLSPLKEEEVYRKFEENLKFSNVKSDEIKKLSDKINSIFNIIDLGDMG